MAAEADIRSKRAVGLYEDLSTRVRKCERKLDDLGTAVTVLESTYNLARLKDEITQAKIEVKRAHPMGEEAAEAELVRLFETKKQLMEKQFQSVTNESVYQALYTEDFQTLQAKSKQKLQFKSFRNWIAKIKSSKK